MRKPKSLGQIAKEASLRWRRKYYGGDAVYLEEATAIARAVAREVRRRERKKRL